MPIQIFITHRWIGIRKPKKKWEFNIGTKFYGVIRNNTIDTYYFDNDWQPLPERQEHFENIENIWANYLTFSTKWKEPHQLKIGLRTEYTDTRGKDFINNTEVKQNYLDWFPSFFYAYQLKENQNLSFSYSRRITRPTFSDLNPFLIKLNDYSYQMGNSDLRPQYTNKFDITYQLKKQSFSLYGNFSKDLISRVYTVDDNNVSYFQPKNFGKEKEIGLDYSYHSDIFKWLYTNISAGIWHYDFELGELKNNRVAYYISAFTRIKFSKNFFLEIQNNFNSKNSSRVGVFDKQYRMDLALQKNVWNGAGIIRLACEDVFNTERDKNISYYQDFDFRFSQKRITQSVVLMFIYTFKNKGRFNEKIVEQGNENRQRL